ncbi:hypothetical protein K2173_000304 [Erythroxylum novogranatense]|uniref:RlpA-like protein double-psi beta-barrel domain-containing protein n=1 Tax=Erythroxylum novogranatense TaxID=1862640 RepID=A0AAV8SX45_9ROSI|nr:hypothetical protein K2173_000304 [Erythroxylum novogranatense]
MALRPQSSIPVLTIVSLLLSSSYSLKAYAQVYGYGTATYYDPPYTPSACFGEHKQGVMVAQVGATLWNGGLACGQTFAVTCRSACKDQKTVKVKIVEFCRTCTDTMALSREAYDQISYTNGGGSMYIYYQQNAKV